MGGKNFGLGTIMKISSCNITFISKYDKEEGELLIFTTKSKYIGEIVRIESKLA